MNIVYFDASQEDANHFTEICRDISSVRTVTHIDNPSELLEYLGDNSVDFVFSEINHGSLNGLEFLSEIRRVSPSVRVVYVTNTPEYAIDAFEVGASGYILKPCCPEKVIIPLNHFLGDEPVIEIKTFGTFDLFVNRKAVMFSNKKAKEILALLVDKCGNSLTMEQIVDVLWEDRPFDENTKVLYRIALKALRDTLKKAGCYHIINESRGQRSLDVTKVKCDYYDYLKNPSSCRNFYGEYMTNYSWGEYTLARISENIYENAK